MGTLKFDHSPTTFGNPGALYPPALPAPVQARKGAVRDKNSSREAEIDDGRLSDIYRSCFQCLTLVNIVSTVNDWCTNVCHVYYNTVCVAGIMQRDIPF